MIKSCPFCGSTKIAPVVNDYGYWQVECECGAMGPQADSDDPAIELEGAKAHWNMRRPDDRIPGPATRAMLDHAKNIVRLYDPNDIHFAFIAEWES